jgi:hypothetical protein
MENTKALDIYDETQRCKTLIRKHIAKICNKAMNAPTIKESNSIFTAEFNRVKDKTFEGVKPTVKPYVVYQVNNHFKYLLD